MKKQADVFKLIVDDAVDILEAETGRSPLNFIDHSTAIDLIKEMVESDLKQNKDAYIEELADSMGTAIEEWDEMTEEQMAREEEEEQRIEEERERIKEKQKAKEEELLRRDREQRTSKLNFNWS